MIPGLVPKVAGWGEYSKSKSLVYFFLGDFYDMDFSATFEPAHFTSQIVELHRRGMSLNGIFGFPVPTACGKMERTVTCEKSWAKSLTHQLKDVIKYNNKTNGSWLGYDVAYKYLIDVVISKLLGPLQSDGHKITLKLIRSDIWERNIGIDMKTGENIIFNVGSTYAHNDIEFNTWRCF